MGFVLFFFFLLLFHLFLFVFFFAFSARRPPEKTYSFSISSLLAAVVGRAPRYLDESAIIIIFFLDFWLNLCARAAATRPTRNIMELLYYYYNYIRDDVIYADGWRFLVRYYPSTGAHRNSLKFNLLFAAVVEVHIIVIVFFF